MVHENKASEVISSNVAHQEPNVHTLRFAVLALAEVVATVSEKINGLEQSVFGEICQPSPKQMREESATANIHAKEIENMIEHLATSAERINQVTNSIH